MASGLGLPRLCLQLLQPARRTCGQSELLKGVKAATAPWTSIGCGTRAPRDATSHSGCVPQIKRPLLGRRPSPPVASADVLLPEGTSEVAVADCALQAKSQTQDPLEAAEQGRLPVVCVTHA